jgi:hypothetical protein
MNRLKQFSSALAVIFCFALMIILLWFGRYLPEPFGSLLSNIFRLLTSPIILEITVAIIGTCIVFTIAYFNQKNSADEFVEIEIPDKKI